MPHSAGSRTSPAVPCVKDRETLLSFYNFRARLSSLIKAHNDQQHRPGQARRREDQAARCARASRGKGDDPLRTMAGNQPSEAPGTTWEPGSEYAGAVAGAPSAAAEAPPRAR